MSVVEVKQQLVALKNAISYVFEIRIALWDRNRTNMQYRSAQVYCNNVHLFSVPLEPSLQCELVEHVFDMIEKEFRFSKRWLRKAMQITDACNLFVFVNERTGTKEFCRMFGKYGINVWY